MPSSLPAHLHLLILFDSIQTNHDLLKGWKELFTKQLEANLGWPGGSRRCKRSLLSHLRIFTPCN